MNTIAERIKFAMEVRKMRQVELVQKTGISKGAFSSYLSGNYNPKQDFGSIGMYLETSRIIHYGISKETCRPEITILAYSPEKGCYECGAEAQGLPRDTFQKEIEKEALFIEKIITNAQEDLQGCDLSSPRLYHGCTGCVRSVKDCRSLGFALFLYLTGFYR